MEQPKCSALFLLREVCGEDPVYLVLWLGNGLWLPFWWKLLHSGNQIYCPREGVGKANFTIDYTWSIMGVGSCSLKLFSITLASSPRISQCQEIWWNKENMALHGVSLAAPGVSIRVEKGQNHQAGLKSTVVTMANSQLLWNTQLHLCWWLGHASG